MHKVAKEIMDRIKSKINTCGVDGITESELCEMKYWACIADAMTSYDYHFKIVEEMEKPENVYGETYNENGRFYTPHRNSMGRYARRGYVHDPDMEHYRDIDKSTMGRMYYTDSNHMGNNHAMNMDYNESRYDKARRGFEEAKEMNPNEDNMEGMNEIFATLQKDIDKLKPKMSANEKSIARTKFTNIANMMMQ